MINPIIDYLATLHDLVILRESGKSTDDLEEEFSCRLNDIRQTMNQDEEARLSRLLRTCNLIP